MGPGGKFGIRLVLNIVVAKSQNAGTSGHFGQQFSAGEGTAEHLHGLVKGDKGDKLRLFRY